MKTIAALCFLTGIAIALIQPVLGAGDDVEPRTRGSAETSPDAEEQPPEQEVELLARYPKRCMRKARAAPTGLVAARRGSIAEIGFPDRRPVARIEVSGDVAWSPSGRFLAERGGRVFDQSGNPQGALFFEPRDWQWSPVADCALATTERGSLTFSIPDSTRKGIRLMDAPVRDFELSPNGRRLAVVVEGSGLWIGDLRGGEVVQATEGPASVVGWFSNRSVLYSKSEEQGRLRYATGGGKTRVVRGASAGGTLVRCRGRVLVVAPDVRTDVPVVELIGARGRIVMDVVSGARTDRGGYSGAACSPDGRFVAAATVRRGEKSSLVLLSSSGAFVRRLVGGATANPQWSQDGLMFVRFGNGGRGRLWLVEPGGDLTRTEYRVGAPTQYDWHAG